jgi:hypothetical protein
MSDQSEAANPRTLLADLETRQEELLRLLDDLEQRTKAALARLSPADALAPQAASAPATVATKSKKAA